LVKNGLKYHKGENCSIEKAVTIKEQLIVPCPGIVAVAVKRRHHKKNPPSGKGGLGDT
jgi:hypothetical protein